MIQHCRLMLKVPLYVVEFFKVAESLVLYHEYLFIPKDMENNSMVSMNTSTLYPSMCY